MIKQKKLVDKSAVAGFVNNADLNNRIAKLATKVKLKAEQDKIKSFKHLIHVTFGVKAIWKIMVIKTI